MTLIRVDFPAPLSPTMAMTSWRWMDRFTDFNASTKPNFTQMSSSRSRGGVLEFLMVCSFLSLFSWYRSLADVIANRELDGA